MVLRYRRALWIAFISLPMSSSAYRSWAISPLTPSMLRDKLIAHESYIREHGEDMPEVKD
jgi:phosphoketolase